MLSNQIGEEAGQVTVDVGMPAERCRTGPGPAVFSQQAPAAPRLRAFPRDRHSRPSTMTIQRARGGWQVQKKPCTTVTREILKHPLLMPYNRLVAVVVGANLMLLGYEITRGGWWSGHGIALKGDWHSRSSELRVSHYSPSAACH